MVKLYNVDYKIEKLQKSVEDAILIIQKDPLLFQMLED